MGHEDSERVGRDWIGKEEVATRKESIALADGQILSGSEASGGEEV